MAGTCMEFLLVVIIGFGPFIYASTQSLIKRSQGIIQTYDDSSFIEILLYETFAFAVIALLLKYRKWKLSDFKLDFHFYYIATALVLVLTRMVLNIFATKITSGLGVEMPSAHFTTGWFSIGCILLINSIYEEVLLTGYLFKRFETLTPVVPLLLSFLLRSAFHTYQGWGMLTSTLTLTLVIGIYYLKYQKLGPVILAHAFGNLFHFLNYYYHWIAF